MSFSEFTILPLLSPDQVLLVGHAGGAGTQRNVAVLIPGEAVLGDAVVSVGEEAGRAAAGAGAAPSDAARRRVADVGGVGGEQRRVQTKGRQVREVSAPNAITLQHRRSCAQLEAAYLAHCSLLLQQVLRRNLH